MSWLTQSACSRGSAVNCWKCFEGRRTSARPLWCATSASHPSQSGFAVCWLWPNLAGVYSRPCSTWAKRCLPWTWMTLRSGLYSYTTNLFARIYGRKLLKFGKRSRKYLRSPFWPETHSWTHSKCQLNVGNPVGTVFEWRKKFHSRKKKKIFGQRESDPFPKCQRGSLNDRISKPSIRNNSSPGYQKSGWQPTGSRS